MNLSLKRVDFLYESPFRTVPASRKKKPNRHLRSVPKLQAIQREPEAVMDREQLGRRAFDVAAAGFGLLVTFPLLLFVALLIVTTSPGPALLRQKRLTKNGKEFILYKFRTMYVDAEAVSGPVLAEENDPRVTFFGRILRKTRIDEIPQLWNVLKGEMSIVGPRPERPEIAEVLMRDLRQFRRRLAVKAGITGLAQIESGYSSCVETYRRKLALDLLYIRNRSALLDLMIVLRTVSVVLLGKGAR